MPTLSRFVSDVDQAMSIKYNTVVYELQRTGKKVTVMSLGEAFFDIPLFKFDNLPYPELYHYSHSRGLPDLRKKLAEFFLVHHDIPLNYEKEILVTAGSKAAIHFALMSVLNSGDEVIVPEPAWVSYTEQIKLCNAIPVNIPYYKNIFDWESYITDRTKAIILNNPQNPSGYAYDLHELEHLLKIAQKYNIWILSDEAYSEFTPEGCFISIGKLDRSKEYSIVFNSISKNYGISGWRLGYAIGNEKVIYNILKVNQHLITCPATILEHYVLKNFYKILDHTIPQIKNLVKQRHQLAEYMDSIGLKYLEGNSTFYFFVSISPSRLNSEDFATTLLNEEYISVVPGLGYGLSCDKFVRVSIGTVSIDEAKDALQKIKKLIDRTTFENINKNRNVLIVAGGKWQVPIIRFMQTKGYKVFVVDPYLYSDGVRIADHHVCADVRDISSIEKSISNFTFEFIATDQSDVSVNTVAILSEKYNLRGNSFQITSLFTNKYLMRRHAEKIGVKVPKFAKIFNLAELHSFIKDTKLPIIIKPADSQSSRGVFKIDKDTIDHIDVFFTESLRFATCGYIIAEEFVKGTEVTVEGLSSDNKHRSLCQSSKTHFRTGIASSLEYPAQIPDTTSSKIEKWNDEFVNTSGLGFGITHAEYIISDEDGEPYLVEIAARGGGTLISSDIVNWVSGVDLYELYYENLLGKRINISELRVLKRNAILQFFEFVPGQVKKINGVDDVIKDERVFRLELLIKEGDHLANATDDRSRHGYVIIFADSKEELDQSLNNVQNIINIEYV